MKRFKNLLFATMLIGSSVLVSCSDDDETIAETNSSATLTAGRSGIIFNTNSNWETNTLFSLRNTTATSATSDVTGSTREILLTATEVGGTVTRMATVYISLPATSTTTSGNITADLAIPVGSTVVANVMLSSVSGSTPGVTYDSEAGTLTITKLTATEIEGTFSATMDGGGTNTLVISNGSFAGKFN